MHAGADLMVESRPNGGQAHEQGGDQKERQSQKQNKEGKENIRGALQYIVEKRYRVRSPERGRQPTIAEVLQGNTPEGALGGQACRNNIHTLLKAGHEGFDRRRVHLPIDRENDFLRTTTFGQT